MYFKFSTFGNDCIKWVLKLLIHLDDDYGIRMVGNVSSVKTATRGYLFLPKLMQSCSPYGRLWGNDYLRQRLSACINSLHSLQRAVWPSEFRPTRSALPWDVKIDC